jgi:hypothetical protein
MSKYQIGRSRDKVNQYLNKIYEMRGGFVEIDIKVLEELLNDIDVWRICCEEIEFKIKSHHQFYSDEKPSVDNDKTNELIIF